MNAFTTFYKRKLKQFKKSLNIFKLKYFYHYIFYDKKLGNIGFDFSQKKSRLEIVQDIINKKIIVKINSAFLPWYELMDLIIKNPEIKNIISALPALASNDTNGFGNSNPWNQLNVVKIV